jgi:ABC-type multidrug transport system fused ATPase/permease subunit
MLMTTLQTARPALMILFGGWLVVTGRASVGTVFVFATVLGPVAGRVRLDHVSFTYPGGGRPAVRDLTADIEPGHLVALVGPSGAGKTTSTGLSARFFDPQHGTVLVDGADLRTVTRSSLASQLGVVLPDTFLFHASIADNLRYARPDATDDDLIAVATAAHLHDFICSLPDGYDTIVGERGHRLSGGEKQRLAIARVIPRDPRIVILDEATSHLDSVSEQHIQAALRPLLRGRTSIVVAHRFSTILAANKILVLDRGRLTDQGTHSQLLARGAACTRTCTTATSAPSPAQPAVNAAVDREPVVDPRAAPWPDRVPPDCRHRFHHGPGAGSLGMALTAPRLCADIHPKPNGHSA